MWYVVTAVGCFSAGWLVRTWTIAVAMDYAAETGMVLKLSKRDHYCVTQVRS